MPNFNILDQSVQEKIRRGHHEYVMGEGRHGTYVEREYLHQEYPKVMVDGKTVNSKAEELLWIKSRKES